MDDLTQPFAVAIEAAQEAGAMLRKEFHRARGPRGKGSHATIDRPAEEVIRSKLLAAFPWNYRGEEFGWVDNGTARHLWLVDPNDGTTAYLHGWRGSAVSIAALCDGVPVLGVVYAFAYPDDEGDLIAWAEGCPLTRNGKPVDSSLRAIATLKPDDVVFLSQDADSNPVANTVCVRPARYIKQPSSAYRLARVAVGDGVAAVSLTPALFGPCGWDYAAGHALLRGVGGVLIDERGQDITYSPDGQSSCRWCFGGARPVVQELQQRDWHPVFTSSPTTTNFGLVQPTRGQAVADAAVLARAHGCFLGQLAGDALGGLVEFKSIQVIRSKYPEGVRDLVDGGTWDNLAGQPTDDSELALMLARMLIQEGRYNNGTALEAYLHWWPHAWDRGGTISQALSSASHAATTAERLGAAEKHASRTSQSNGSLMRISPLGIFGAGRPDQAADWAREDSRLTHPHLVCQDACAVFVAAIATAIGNGSSGEECYQAAVKEAERSSVQPGVRLALENARLARPVDYGAQMGWVLIALQNAFYQLLHAPSLEEGVIDTVMQGGDTDTNGAIAGAILGAVHGRKQVPDRWVRAVLSCRTLEGMPTAHPQPPEFWPVDALELAEALLWAGMRKG